MRRAARGIILTTAVDAIAYQGAENEIRTMISFVIPAHNEQACLGRTLQAINDAARALGQPHEVIVVNDASTDRTPEIAREYNAAVVTVNHRQIAATRNSGGRAASGERIFFVDADTTVNPRAVASALRFMDRGAVGGGAPTVFGDDGPFWVRVFGFLPIIAAKLTGFTGGAFMFCTREAFQATGGFDERLFWSEEGPFALALKGKGRFVVLWTPVLTSARRFRTLSGRRLLVFLGRMVSSPRKIFTSRSTVKDIWYDSNRDNDDKTSGSMAVRILSNAIVLLIVVVLLTGPVWNFIPWSQTPRGTPLGHIRLVIAIFLCHVGLIFWPCAIILFGALLRRRHWLEWIKLALLFAFCLWQAWESTQDAISWWRLIGHWLAHFHKG